MAWTGATGYTFSLAIVIVLVYLYQKLHSLRFNINNDVPQPPSHLLFGNLKTMAEFTAKGRTERHSDYVFEEIGESLGNPPVWKVDLRPLGPVMCMVSSHEVAEQLSRVSKLFPYSVPKSPTTAGLSPIVGKTSILLLGGEKWKALRKLFNPGFAPQYLSTLLPRICDKTSIFIERLDECVATGHAFDLDELCVNLTFDIIMSVVLDIDTNAQLSDKFERDPIVSLYSKLLKAYDTPGNLLNLSPKRYFERLYYGYLADKAVKAAVQQRFDEYQTQDLGTKRRSVTSLALASLEGRSLDSQLLQEIADQIKSFLFAGHDTTSILIQWFVYELSRTPAALSALRAELDEVFGLDPNPQIVAEAFITHGEELMPKLKYTTAVIKETLRLHPPGASARMSPPGSGMTVNIDGNPVCLDGMVLYHCHYLIQRDRSVYGDTADEWIPERWLDEDDPNRIRSPFAERLGVRFANSDKLETGTIPASAYRPFERGPRNCIGQELANIEARVILASIVRRYDFQKVGLGEFVTNDKGQPVLSNDGTYLVKNKVFNKYQVTSKPVDGMRMKVKFATTS